MIQFDCCVANEQIVEHREDHGGGRGYSLRPDRSCIKFLLWRYELPEHVDVVRFAAYVEREGWTAQTNSVLPLHTLTHEHGHRLIIVPATRRVQLRLHYMVPREHREAYAQRIGMLLDNIREVLGRAAPTARVMGG